VSKILNSVIFSCCLSAMAGGDCEFYGYERLESFKISKCEIESFKESIDSDKKIICITTYEIKIFEHLFEVEIAYNPTLESVNPTIRCIDEERSGNTTISLFKQSLLLCRILKSFDDSKFRAFFIRNGINCQLYKLQLIKRCLSMKIRQNDGVDFWHENMEKAKNLELARHSELYHEHQLDLSPMPIIEEEVANCGDNFAVPDIKVGEVYVIKHCDFEKFSRELLRRFSNFKEANKHYKYKRSYEEFFDSIPIALLDNLLSVGHIGEYLIQTNENLLKLIKKGYRFGVDPFNDKVELENLVKEFNKYFDVFLMKNFDCEKWLGIYRDFCLGGLPMVDVIAGREVTLTSSEIRSAYMHFMLYSGQSLYDKNQRLFEVEIGCLNGQNEAYSPYINSIFAVDGKRISFAEQLGILESLKFGVNKFYVSEKSSEFCQRAIDREIKALNKVLKTHHEEFKKRQLALEKEQTERELKIRKEISLDLDFEQRLNSQKTKDGLQPNLADSTKILFDLESEDRAQLLAERSKEFQSFDGQFRQELQPMIVRLNNANQIDCEIFLEGMASQGKVWGSVKMEKSELNFSKTDDKRFQFTFQCQDWYFRPFTYFNIDFIMQFGTGKVIAIKFNKDLYKMVLNQNNDLILTTKSLFEALSVYSWKMQFDIICLLKNEMDKYSKMDYKGKLTERESKDVVSFFEKTSQLANERMESVRVERQQVWTRNPGWRSDVSLRGCMVQKRLDEVEKMRISKQKEKEMEKEKEKEKEAQKLLSSQVQNNVSQPVPAPVQPVPSQPVPMPAKSVPEPVPAKPLVVDPFLQKKIDILAEMKGNREKILQEYENEIANLQNLIESNLEKLRRQLSKDRQKILGEELQKDRESLFKEYAESLVVLEKFQKDGLEFAKLLETRRKIADDMAKLFQAEAAERAEFDTARDIFLGHTNIKVYEDKQRMKKPKQGQNPKDGSKDNQNDNQNSQNGKNTKGKKK